MNNEYYGKTYSMYKSTSIFIESECESYYDSHYEMLIMNDSNHDSYYDLLILLKKENN
jgi:hypothetical protein